MPKGAKRLAVYTIIETDEGSFWREIGGAFVNRDDSLNVFLDAFPVNGRLHIREKRDAPIKEGASG